MTVLYYVPQYFSTTLNVGGGIDATQTTGITLQSVTGLDITKPGIVCLSYSDPLSTGTAEWITFTSINGSNVLQGVTRGAEGYTAKSHSNGATAVFPLSKSHINNINDEFAARVVATGAEVNTGTDNAKYVSPKAIADSSIPTGTSTTTFTNKRIQKRVVPVTQHATPTYNTDNGDIFYISGLAQAITSMTTNLTGTPVADEMIEFEFIDDGTARAITWGASFAATTVALPITTVISTLLRVLFQRNKANTVWDCVAVS